MDNPVASLSESQKACLRLVARNMSSKEIAIETAFTPQTVDTYIKTGMGKLGVSSRREAARILADWELSQKSGSLSQTVVSVVPRADEEVAVDRGGVGRPTALPPVGGRRNELGSTGRMLAALKVAVVGTTGVIALILLIAGVLQTIH